MLYIWGKFEADLVSYKLHLSCELFTGQFYRYVTWVRVGRPYLGASSKRRGNRSRGVMVSYKLEVWSWFSGFFFSFSFALFFYSWEKGKKRKEKKNWFLLFLFSFNASYLLCRFNVLLICILFLPYILFWNICLKTYR